MAVDFDADLAAAHGAQPAEAPNDFATDLAAAHPDVPEKASASVAPVVDHAVAPSSDPLKVLGGAMFPLYGAMTDPNLATMAKNLPASASKFGSGLVDLIAHPVTTAENLGHTVLGGVEHLLPERAVQAIPTHDADRAAASAFGDYLANRWGGIGKASDTMLNDPVGAASDVSMLLGGGAGVSRALSKIPLKATAGPLSQVADTLGAGAAATNPINAATPILSPVANGLGNTAAYMLGNWGTGTGAESVRQAYKAGATGGADADSFWGQLSGDHDMSRVVDTAKEGIARLRAAMGARYLAAKNGPNGWGTDNTPLDFAPIHQAYNDFMDSRTTNNGLHMTMDPTEINQIVGKAPDPNILGSNGTGIGGAIAEWMQDPVHTADSLDALKRRIASIAPDNVQHTNVTAAVKHMTDAIKNTIRQQAPAYAPAMEDYGNSLDQLNQLEKTFNLRDSTAVGTALTKLQSLMRNNVNSNYGYRTGLINDLQDTSGVNLMPALAGQALNSWSPRGLVGNLVERGMGGGALWSLAHGDYLRAAAMGASLPFVMPKVVGAGAYVTGRGQGALSKIPYKPDITNALLNQTNRDGGE